MARPRDPMLAGCLKFEYPNKKRSIGYCGCMYESYRNKRAGVTNGGSARSRRNEGRPEPPGETRPAPRKTRASAARTSGGGNGLRACAWWYGGETLSPDICIVFDPAGARILVLSPPLLAGVTGGIELAGERTLESNTRVGSRRPRRSRSGASTTILRQMG